MNEEEEDRALLSSLGVTSANPDEIEHDILKQARNQEGEIEDDEHLERQQTNEQSSTTQADVLNKLRAINVEINAVASAVEDVKNFSNTEERLQTGDDDDNATGDLDGEKSILQASTNDLTLQHALASDRLESLKRTKAQLEKQIENLGDGFKDIKNEKILQALVKEEPNRKRKQKEIPKTNKKLKKQHKKVAFNDDDDFDAVLNAASAGFVETERDELVRKGILTPFHNLKGYERRIEESGPSNTVKEVNNDLSSRSIAKAVKSISEAANARPTTKLLDPDSLPRLDPPARPFLRLKTPFKTPHSPDSEGGKNDDLNRKKKRPLPEKKWRKKASREENSLEENDDARGSSIEEENQEDIEHNENDENNEASFVTLEGGLKIPENIFSQLFDYQKIGVQWLWELHCQKAGGIIGDEMGLGKTIQVLSFLGALHFSKLYKPSIIICPVTLLRQWKREAQKWYPNFHVEILHDSARDSSSKKKQPKSDESDYDYENENENETADIDNDEEQNLKSNSNKKWDYLINRVLRTESGLLITTYEQLRILGGKLLDIEWGYAVLDEGHRIRNPNAEVTLVCKQLQTVHRVIMTGAPIQNRLSELWSLFDFVFPGKLGVLPVFEAEFAVPISVGGYANASPLQVSTAYRCAVVLRDLIMPYLLRRMKADVNAHLPTKTEHVLFCSLTTDQKSLYRSFLASSEVEQIFNGSRNSLYGIDIMRKICNHPDLLEREHAAQNPDYGNPERSGKLKVVKQVLKVWKEQNHRVLLFAQTQQMLDIIENFMINDGYMYRRMDGLTPVKQRMTLMDEFNNCGDIFVFILTTKVGGLGTNLTGANRVIIFDPDWNPSTDMQARERAWRIGQTKDVTVYRLITRGTIEEKVYHRQIYKHFLTNKILKNPQQKRFFKARDMKDLFTLNDDKDTETSNLFGQLSEDVNVVAPNATNENGSEFDENYNATGQRKSSKNKEKEKEKIDDGISREGEETNILKSLFDAQGIHSAVNHDLIMNANDEEKTKLDEQANQVAQRAAEALRQSRMIRTRESISIPTWTGRSGSAGAPGSPATRKFGSTINPKLTTKTRPDEGPSNHNNTSNNRFVAGASGGKALSSSQLLAKIRGTQEQAVGDAMGSVSGARLARNLGGVQPEVLIRQICTFLQQRNGVSDSGSIVQHFKDRIPTKDLAVFKSLLKEIAVLQKNANGSSWILKPEYQ